MREQQAQGRRRYVVLGAGAIGATLGGLLARAGCQVVLVARGEHARVLAERGLTLRTPDGTHVLRLPVVPDAARLELQAEDVLLLAVKSQATQGLLDTVGPLPVAGGGTAAERLPLVCAQNGVANEVAALRTFTRVVGLCVQLPAQHLEPGEVVAQGTPVPGVLHAGLAQGGVDDAVEQLVADLQEAGFRATAREDVMAWKRAKLLDNLANALDALTNPGGGGPEEDGDARAELRRRAVQEGREALAAAGLDVVDPETWRSERGGLDVDTSLGARGGSSSWQSAARGTGSIESDWLNGEIALLGRLHGVPTPVNVLLQREAGALVRGGRRPGSLSARELLARC